MPQPVAAAPRRPRRSWPRAAFRRRPGRRTSRRREHRGPRRRPSAPRRRSRRRAGWTRRPPIGSRPPGRRARPPAACSAVRPTEATSGSVNTTCGTAAWSAVATCRPRARCRTGSPAARAAIASPTIRAWYLPWWVSGARPVDVARRVEPLPVDAAATSPVSSTVSQPARRQPDGLEAEVVGVRPAAGGDQQLVDHDRLAASIAARSRRRPRRTESSPVSSRTSHAARTQRRRRPARRRTAPPPAAAAARGPAAPPPTRAAATPGPSRSRPPRRRARRAGRAPRARRSPPGWSRRARRPGRGSAGGPDAAGGDHDRVPGAQHLVAVAGHRPRSPASRPRPRTTGDPGALGPVDLARRRPSRG